MDTSEPATPAGKGRGRRPKRELRSFSTRYLETLKPVEQAKWYWDPDTRWLGFRVSPTGHKGWGLKYPCKVHGGQCRCSLGDFPALSLHEARQKAAELTRLIQRSRCPRGEQEEHDRSPTVRELCEDWCRVHATRKLGKKTAVDDRYKLDKDIIPTLGHLKAEALTKRDLIRLGDVIASRVRVLKNGTKIVGAPNRADATVGLVRRIYGWAIRRDMIKGVNPAAGIARFGELKARNDYLNAGQIHAFWHSIDSWPGSEPAHLVIKLCLVTGQRESQIVGISRDELELGKEPAWNVPSSRSKNKVGHELPLTPLALSLLQRAMEISPHPKLLFPNPKGTTHIGAHAPTTLWKRAKKVRGENGLAESRLADLRTTVGSHLAKLRVDPTTIAAVLDHRSVLKGSVTMKHYVGYDFVPEKREALLRWDRRLREIIAGQLEEGPRDNVVPLRA